MKAKPDGSHYCQTLVRAKAPFEEIRINGNPVTLPAMPRSLNMLPAMAMKTVARFVVARDGRYAVKSAMNAWEKSNNGVAFRVTVDSQFLASVTDRQICDGNSCPVCYSPTTICRDLDLRAGQEVRLVVDSLGDAGADRCGGGFAVIREGDIPETRAEVVNFAFAVADETKDVSSFDGAGIFATPGETYAVAFYSACGRESGHGVFMIGDETKDTEHDLCLQDEINGVWTDTTVIDRRTRFDLTENCYVLFEDVEADANGEIRGLFSCPEDREFAAFNGLSIRGAFRDAVSPGLTIIFR